MGWILAGSILAALLVLALVVDLKDRKRGGNKLARGAGLGEARRDNLNPNPQVGDHGGYLNMP
ncbi:hypothetical protein [Amycolatopsis sp. H20-H5]|uniref:hypothetical protein n=1 Tax=Amycolatopsis sp. H20-H5 TaxID=3046309 RepID=UPI002DB7F42C|nr:hypothetical protein [Amycolatopsis sp. H20-H5]MEC3982748.1 hypothetical protein [Amycolatopsis sp. H20-H5]